jgi:predicted AAA+ superfamily ATPase
MSISTIYDLCTPRPDVLTGTASDSDFAADLSHVIRGHGGPAEYSDPRLFFANTYPTRGLKSLLANVCSRLSGRGSAVAAIFRLDTSFGGGKTHGLIALVHAARGMQGVANPAEFIDAGLLPTGEVRVAAFDGENADPANGRRTGGRCARVHTVG